MKIDKVKFKQKVVPGDTLIFSCSLITQLEGVFVTCKDLPMQMVNFVLKLN